MSDADRPRHLRPARGRVRRLALRPVPPPPRRGPRPPVRAAARLGASPATPTSTPSCATRRSRRDRQRRPDPAHRRRDRAARRRPPGRAHAGAARRPRPRPAAQARGQAVPAPRGREACATLVEERVRRPGRRARRRARHRRTPVELDLIADFAYPLPVEIFCQMLGIPEEDHPIFRYWVNCIARSLDPVMDPAERDELMADIDDMYAFLEELVAAKRGRDDDDVLAGLDPRRGGRRDAHPRGAARPGHHALRRRPRADRRPRRQRHAGAARLPRPVGGCCRPTGRCCATP